MTTKEKIGEECNRIKELLLNKNKKYGDSAFSKGVLFSISPGIAIKARINDKINRIINDNNDEDEDVIDDLIGYLILLNIEKKYNQNG